MESKIIFPRIFNDIPFIGSRIFNLYRLNQNIISYFFLHSAYSPRRLPTDADAAYCSIYYLHCEGRGARVNPMYRSRVKGALCA